MDVILLPLWPKSTETCSMGRDDGINEEVLLWVLFLLLDETVQRIYGKSCNSRRS